MQQWEDSVSEEVAVKAHRRQGALGVKVGVGSVAVMVARIAGGKVNRAPCAKLQRGRKNGRIDVLTSENRASPRSKPKMRIERFSS